MTTEDKKTKKEARRLQKYHESAAKNLRRQMIKYAQDEKFAEAFAAAIPLYWNEFYTLETAAEMDANESLRFFDWFLYDYRHEGKPPLVERFKEEEYEDLTEMKQQLLDAWIAAEPASAYEYLDFDGFSQRFKLRDFFTDEEMLVHTSVGPGQAKRNDIILGRIVPVGTELQLSAVGAYIPQEEIEGLKEMIEEAKAEDKKEHPDATHADFMRRKGHLLVHYALKKSEESDRPAVARLNDSVGSKARKTLRRSTRKVTKKAYRRQKN